MHCCQTCPVALRADHPLSSIWPRSKQQHPHPLRNSHIAEAAEGAQGMTSRRQPTHRSCSSAALGAHSLPPCPLSRVLPKHTAAAHLKEVFHADSGGACVPGQATVQADPLVAHKLHASLTQGLLKLALRDVPLALLVHVDEGRAQGLLICREGPGQGSKAHGRTMQGTVQPERAEQKQAQAARRVFPSAGHGRTEAGRGRPHTGQITGSGPGPCASASHAE